MSPEEKSLKLQEEKRKRKMLRKENNTSGKKIYCGMHCFDEEDNKDFNVILFNMMEEEKLDPGMKLFFEVQKENIGKKSSKGYRWHPKYVFHNGVNAKIST